MLKTRIEGYVTFVSGGRNRYIIVETEDGLKHTILDYDEYVHRYKVGEYINIEVMLKQFKKQGRFSPVKGYELRFIGHDN